MSTYNNSGIQSELDWQGIREMTTIGLLAVCMVLVGDMLRGWGVHDTSASGLEGFLSAHPEISDNRIFWK